MFLPERKIPLNKLEKATQQNSGYFIAFIPVKGNAKRTSTVVDHSSNLIDQGYSYNKFSDSWQIWVGSVIRTYRRYDG